MFRKDPVIQRIALGQSAVLVIDDALQEPQYWVEEAVAGRESLVEAPYNTYPGMEMRLPEGVAQRCGEYFESHLRKPFGVRRLVRQHAKLALVTHRPSTLQPLQTVPHVDDLRLEAGQAAFASVLYLFHDERLGGTSFYRPRVARSQLQALFGDATRLDADAFAQHHGLPRAYPGASNQWFERVLTVPPRWNRLIVYPGTIFHSGDMPDPQSLSADPRTGRLTLNGFFVCRRQLAG